MFYFIKWLLLNGIVRGLESNDSPTVKVIVIGGLLLLTPLIVLLIMPDAGVFITILIILTSGLILLTVLDAIGDVVLNTLLRIKLDNIDERASKWIRKTFSFKPTELLSQKADEEKKVKEDA